MICKHCNKNELSKTQKKFCSKLCEKAGKSNVNSFKSIGKAWEQWTPSQKLVHGALCSVKLGLTT